MSHNTKQEQILEDLRKKFEKDPHVLGMVVFGSQAQGSTDEFSDLDVYVVLTQNDGRERVYKRIQGVRVDILFDTVKKIGEYLKLEEGKFWRNVSHMLAHGKILFSRSGKLLSLQEQAKKNLLKKTILRRDEKIMHMYSIEDYWYKAQRDAKKKDTIAFQRDASHILNNSIELILKVQGAFLPPARELDVKLKRVDGVFRNLILAFYKESNLEKQLSALKAIVSHTTKRFGQVPNGWMIKR